MRGTAGLERRATRREETRVAWPASAPACPNAACRPRPQAHDMFDEVLISPHLDDGTKTMHWRNMLWFDPLVKDK